MNDAITLATNGGYTAHDVRIEAIVQDPLFWRALSRAKSWPAVVHVGRFAGDLHTVPQETWLYHALHYFEVALTGGDTEEFWKELLE